jgi:hypothetical protein
MDGPLLPDLESLEAISQDDETRRIFQRMAAMSMNGQIGRFLHELDDDDDLDEASKGTLKELARDEVFLLAVDDYVRRTERLH